MINNGYEIGRGRKLVEALKNGKIRKDHRPNHGKRFSGGYEQMYFEKFCRYLGNVSRYAIDRSLEERGYDGQ